MKVGNFGQRRGAVQVDLDGRSEFAGEISEQGEAALAAQNADPADAQRLYRREVG